ncbi:lysoplasmalogenase [Oceanobacillus halophilus]|uniref:Lysoplasmalogenase n=1 Tax=Oceanobacillus halophilus TaxID=930130 RepID=A0A495A2G9_9BACI|nr:lysoplasmalogenase [Oceanobacillus halophilus]RKQ33546.1 lysoplasmalogenase [Oceanobacillus halophilus]
MILYRSPILILILSLFYIFIIPKEPLAFQLFFKVLPMALIIGYALNQFPKGKSKTHWFILTGLSFSIIGDATIHWFVIGLSAFLVGHFFYILGFIKQFRFSKIGLLLSIPIAIYSVWMMFQLTEALNKQGNQVLIIPVIIYIIAISIMFWTAIMTSNKWAYLGSLLFIISDSILAWNMFVSPISNAHQYIMLTYYAAQFFIAHSLSTFNESRKPTVW